MAYSPTNWKDRAVDNPRTYTMQDNGDGTFTLTPAPGTIHEQGTPVNAVNMNKIEQRLVAIKQLHQLTTDDGAGVGVSGVSFRTLVKSGKYVCSNMLNAPNGETSSSFFVDVTSDPSFTYTFQIAKHASNNRVFYCIQNGGTWQPWVEIITSDGGTVDGELKSTNKFPLMSKFPGLKSYVFHSSGDGNFYIAPSGSVDGEDWDFSKALRMRAGELDIGGKQAWHTGDLRTTNGYPEFLINGVWMPADTSAGLGHQRTFDGYNINLKPYNKTWVTLVDVQGTRGRIEQLSAYAAINTDGSNDYPTASCRITIDGVVQTWTNNQSADYDSAHAIINFLLATSPPIPFFNNFKVEVKVDSNVGTIVDAIGGNNSIYPIIYRLPMGV